MSGMSAKKFSEIVVWLLEETPIVEDPEELARFKRLSSREMYAVAYCLKAGEASTVEEALQDEAVRDWLERREAHERALELRKQIRVVVGD
jgi:hypothetical protein